MNTDPIPVWKFFDIPQNAIDICHELAILKADKPEEKYYWQRAANFLENVKSQTANQLSERDFDWMLKLRVLFEKDEEVAKVKTSMNK